MKKNIKQFLLQSAIISVVLYVCWAILYVVVDGPWLSPAIPVLIPFFYIITCGIYYFLIRSAGERFPRFVSTFMGMTIGKILLFALAIILYVVLNKADAFPFTIAFLIFYLIFTIYEINAFLRDTREMKR
jgi:F0F1-type ATP synthase assembly protein I